MAAQLAHSVPAEPSLPHHRLSAQPESVRSVLQEIFDLLDEYGPSWYPEELRERAARALANSRR